MDGRDFAGSCDDGFSCAYTNTIAWANDTTPLPMENNPRVVFERLFGDTGSTDPAIRKARLRKDASLLDSVTERAGDLSRQLGSGDRAKLGQYLDAVRDIERRIQMAEAQSDRELPVVDQPAGIPGTLGEHAGLMFDLQALAYETDLTRVATFMMGREITGRTYAEIGGGRRAPSDLAPPEGSGEAGEADEDQPVPRAALLLRFLERLQATPDGDGDAAGSFDDRLRGRHGRQQRSRVAEPADPAGGGRRRHGRGATSGIRRRPRWPTCTSACSTSWACRPTRSGTPTESCRSIRCRPRSDGLGTNPMKGRRLYGRRPFVCTADGAAA